MWASCGPVKLSHKANFHKPTVASQESFMFTFGNEEHCSVSTGVVDILFLSVVNFLCFGDKIFINKCFINISGHSSIHSANISLHEALGELLVGKR